MKHELERIHRQVVRNAQICQEIPTRKRIWYLPTCRSQMPLLNATKWRDLSTPQPPSSSHIYLELRIHDRSFFFFSLIFLNISIPAIFLSILHFTSSHIFSRNSIFNFLLNCVLRRLEHFFSLFFSYNFNITFYSNEKPSILLNLSQPLTPFAPELFIFHELSYADGWRTSSYNGIKCLTEVPHVSFT